MPAIAAASHIASMDPDAEHLVEVEAFLVLIEKYIHPIWQKLSVREIAAVLHIFQKYGRPPRQLVLARAPYHMDEMLRRASAPGAIDSLAWMPPLDNERNRRQAFASLEIMPREGPVAPSPSPSPSTASASPTATGSAAGSGATSTEHAAEQEQEAVSLMLQDASLLNAASAMGALGVRPPLVATSVVGAALDSQEAWVRERAGGRSGGGVNGEGEGGLDPIRRSGY